MKQRDLFYCHAVFFVSAYALHTVLRVPSGLRLEGIFVVRKKVWYTASKKWPLEKWRDANVNDL
jgi:hypothetical protein